MAAIGLMLGLIFYIFGVMFTQLFKDLDNTSYNYFGSLGWTFFTLFQMMTLDDWASVCREVIEVYKWAWLPFIMFVIISGFIVVNLIIAVICDAIGALHTDEKAKLHGDFDEEGSDASDSQIMDLREQLDTLEDQMEDLTRIQARTYHTLEYLTRQIQMQKVKQELQSKTSQHGFAEAMKKLKSVRRESQTLSQKDIVGIVDDGGHDDDNGGDNNNNRTNQMTNLDDHATLNKQPKSGNCRRDDSVERDSDGSTDTMDA
jgi:Ion transport protein